MKSNTLNKKIIAPNSKTRQGYASVFVLSRDKNWLAYGLRKNIFLRNTQNFSESKIFTKHLKGITGIAFSPDNDTVASSDEEAVCYIWSLSTFKEIKKFEGVFAGEINGLEFSEDGLELLVFGKGKSTFAKTIDLETGKDLRRLEYLSSSVLTGCFSTQSPSGLMIGCEDGCINFYTGGSMKNKEIFKEHEGKFVSKILLSPDKTKFVSVAFDKKIVIYDAIEGKQLDVIDTSKVEGGHKMAIISSCFLDDERFVTASIDRSVKIWNLKEKTLLYTLIPKEGKLDTSFIMCGVQTDGKKIICLTLSSVMYMWNLDTLADNKLPDLTFDGHQGPITSIAYSKSTKEIISSDSTGLVLIWPETGSPRRVCKKDESIFAVALSQDESLIYVCLIKGSLYAFDKTTLEEKFKVENLGSNFRGIAPSKKNNEDVYLILTKELVKISKGGIASKIELKKEARAIEVNDEVGEILVGDNKGELHIFDFELKEKSSKLIHSGEYSSIKLSPDGKFLASGDNKQTIFICDPVTKNVLINRFCYHKSKIIDLDWTSDSKFLISASLDFSVMLWDIEAKKRSKNFGIINDAPLSSVKFINDNKDFVCGGEACTIEIVKFE